MIKDFIRHSFIYGIGNFLTRGISFLLLPFYTRTLTTEDYGIISFLSSFSVFLLPLISLEITQAIGIYYAEATNVNEKNEYLSTAFTFLLVTSAVFFLTVMLFYKPISILIMGDQFHPKIFIVAMLSTILSMLFTFSQVQLLWRLKSLAYSLISFLSAILTIILTISFVLILNYGVEGIFLAGLIGNALGILSGFFCANFKYNFKININKLKQLLRFSLPLIPANIGYYAFLYVDQLAVKHFLGLREAGIYGVACRFVIVINLLIYAVGNALPPLIYHQHQKPETKQSLEKISRFFLCITFSLVLGLSLTGKNIILLFTTPDYLEASYLLPLLALATFFSNMYLLTPGLGIAKKTHIIASLNILGGIINLVGNIYWIPRLGLMGGAIATLVSSLSIFLLYFISSQHFYPIQYQRKKIITAIFFFVFMLSLSYQFNLSFSTALLTDLSIKGLLLICIFITFLLLMTSKEERQALMINGIVFRNSTS